MYAKTSYSLKLLLGTCRSCSKVSLMLIINADDFGRNTLATDNILRCFQLGLVTSASAMMFMENSEFSSTAALERGLDIGMHVNFTTPFDGNLRNTKLQEYQSQIAKFLLKNRYCSVMYHPLLKNQFNYVYNAQYDEFIRLYNKIPSHVDGHHHMHLCANMLIGKIIPDKIKVRPSFTFYVGEKNILNRFYRRCVDAWLINKYQCVDYFFSIEPINQELRLKKIVNLAKVFNVELMVHPERKHEVEYMMQDEYRHLIDAVEKGGYNSL